MGVGWVCPKCGNVYAPYVFKCTVCPVKAGYGTNANDTELDDVKIEYTED